MLGLIKMNRERLKSIVLVSLFILSIFLTQKVFIEIPYDLTLAFGKSETIKKADYIVSDIFSPERYLINYSKDNHTVLYSDKSYPIWNESKKIIKNVFDNNKPIFEKISYDVFSEYNSVKSIMIQFPEPIQSKVFANIIDIQKKKQIYNVIASIREIYINLEETPFLIISNNDDYIKVSNININTITLNNTVNTIKKDENYVTYHPRQSLLDTSKEIYAPHIMNNIPYDIYVLNKTELEEELEIESLVESFFSKDINYIKNVMEKDANIYIFEDEKIIISESGVLEYYNNIEETVSSRDYYKSINTALNFMMQKDKLPNDLYLKSAKEIESNGDKGYRFIFGYKINEIPIITNSNVYDYYDNKLTGPIEIEVYNEHVKSYKTFLRSVQSYEKKDTAQIWGPLYHITNNAESIEIIIDRFVKEKNIDSDSSNIEFYKGEILKSIKDIKLGYYDIANLNESQKLIAVWIIDIGESTYIFDMEDGRILNRKDLR